MRNAVTLVLVFVCQFAWAQGWEDQRSFNAASSTATLRIISSTDTALFEPLIIAFVESNPDVAIEYLVTGTADIDKRFRENPEAFDIAISSAMDLQLKLTNDGYALTVDDINLPDWAQWRRSLFAFTSEPATIVVNRQAFEGLPIPASRQELIQALRSRPDIFQNRVGTYDVRRSGLGYLFATQDARASETFWRLMEVMGSLDVQLYCCSGEMIDDLTDGTIAVAYNVLGSYANARTESKDTLEIIVPDDFSTTMMRTAFISRESRQPDAAQRFVRFLLTYQANRTDGLGTLPSLDEGGSASDAAKIALEPALMTFLDNLKRSKFLLEWENALIQN